VAEPIVIAHRTCPLDAPENSLAGMAVAAEQPAAGVEIDLRMSLDQRPFLMHDWTMKRTTGWRLPLELTPSPIVRRQKLADGSPIPSLEAALDALAPRMLLAIDIKTPWAIIPLVSEVRRRYLQERVLVWCTSALAVRYAARWLPNAEVAYLKDLTDWQENLAFLDRAKRLGARAVSAYWPAIEGRFVAEAHARGLRVYSYHARFEATADKLSSGLDGVITDAVIDTRRRIDALPGC
jgi:glycerophosphoryl diester phosphodiesterase